LSSCALSAMAWLQHVDLTFCNLPQPPKLALHRRPRLVVRGRSCPRLRPTWPARATVARRRGLPRPKREQACRHALLVVALSTRACPRSPWPARAPAARRRGPSEPPCKRAFRGLLALAAYSAVFTSALACAKTVARRCGRLGLHTAARWAASDSPQRFLNGCVAPRLTAAVPPAESQTSIT
jgi:hypothetical protein